MKSLYLSFLFGALLCFPTLGNAQAYSHSIGVGVSGNMDLMGSSLLYYPKLAIAGSPKGGLNLTLPVSFGANFWSSNEYGGNFASMLDAALLLEGAIGNTALPGAFGKVGAFLGIGPGIHAITVHNGLLVGEQAPGVGLAGHFGLKFSIKQQSIGFRAGGIYMFPDDGYMAFVGSLIYTFSTD